MKKFYNEPEMNISLFSQENVVTESTPGPQLKTAEELATAALNQAGTTTNVTLDSWSN